MKKILILSANPINTDKLRLDKEVREIQAALERSKSREEFELITKWAVRIDDLRRALLDEEPQIVHFSGHGIGSDGIVIENNSGTAQLVSTESLTNLFELFKDKVECVLLNACYSEAQAEAIYQYIDCVIGMKNPIQDNTAINFSKGFYDAIGAGRNYADAFKFGCNNIDLNNIPESLTPTINIRNNSKTLFSNNQPTTKPKEQKSNMADRRFINMGSGNYNERIQGNYIQGNYYAAGEKQSLAEAAVEIQKLLKQLEQTNPTATEAQKEAFVSAAIAPTKKERLINALKEGGKGAIEEFLDNPYVNVGIKIIEGWKNA